MVGEESPSLSLNQEDQSSVGIIPRALNHLFDELRIMEVEFAMRVSYLELYNEELCDLLSSDDSAKIRIFDDVAKKGSVIVQGLEEIPVKCKSDVYRLLAKGQDRRKTAATLMNAQSSRSHTIFTILVHIKENNNDGEEMLKIGKLNLVDLAGSENISKAGNEKGIRTRESVNINQSLLTLGRVITALVERTPHIPYRESKLTRLLQESLGGRTKTSIIATVSPGHKDLEETLSTLEYAHRAKNIQNKPEINQRLTKKVVLKEYTEEIEKLKRDLIATREKNGIYLASDTYNEMLYKMEKDQKELSENITRCRALKEELADKTKLFDECSRNLEFISEELDKEKSKNQITESELKRTKRNLRKTERKNEEKTQIIKSQQHTEQQLTEQAKQLISVVDEASMDTRSLLESIDRRKNVETKAVSASENLLSNLKEKIVAMSGEVDELKSSHKENVQIVVGDMDENTKLNRKFIATVGETLKNLQEMRVKNGDDIKAIYKQLKLDICEKSEKNSVNFAELQKAFESQQAKFTASIDEKIAEIEQILCQDRTRNANFQTELFSKLEKRTELIDKFYNDLKTKIEGFAAEFVKVSTSLRGMTEMQKTRYNAVMQLMKEIDASNDECGTMAATVDKIDESLQHFDRNALKFFRECNQVHDGECKSTIETFRVQHESSDKNLTENLSVVKNLTSANNSDVKSSVAQQAKLLSSYRDETQNSVAFTQISLNDVIDESNKIDKKSIDQLQSTFTAENERTTSIAQEVKSIVQQTLANIVVATGANLHNNLQQCTTSIDDFEQQDVLTYKSTGETPARKDYRVNRNLVATSPHERIIKRFHLESGMLDSSSLNNSIAEVIEVS